METFTVRLKDKDQSYPIYVGQKSLLSLGKFLRKHTLKGRVVLVTNPTVGALYARPVRKALEQEGYGTTLFEVPDGEEYKSLETARDLFKDLVEAGTDRETIIAALGGGVIGDLAGFVAATWLRGVPFIQLPTTLVGQVDSSIGGKVGVDLPEGKNLVGAFYQPRLVVIDPVVLFTLPDRELRCGLSETIKAGIIGDPSILTVIEKQRDGIFRKHADVLEDLILRALKVKMDIVTRDPYEQKQRKILNLGHTFAHALETATGYETYHHGEAVSIGIIGACLLAEGELKFPRKWTDRLRYLFGEVGLPITHSQDPGDLLAVMGADKKKKRGKLVFVLPQKIGRVVVQEGIANNRILNALERLQEDRLWQK
ncbi:MAG: 3-dehydroquinate synthase [Armatimonadetes bacterium]|nr:3-dehydroquinate synthase [Armatimonadota bacterium]